MDHSCMVCHQPSLVDRSSESTVARSEDTNERSQDNLDQRFRWLRSLRDNFKGEASLDNFFEVHLRRPHTEESDTIRALVEESGAELSKAANAVAKASSEVQMYKPLITYLKAVVSTFPTETEPQIYDTHDTLLPCIDPDDHSTAPDITATRPGGNEVKNEEIVISDEGKWKGEWLDVGTVLELRLRTDILNDDSDAERTLVKIANSARHLLTSGRYCAFVLAVNGLQARILCFDRAGWQASEAFDWTRKTEIIPIFFWRLYNPDRESTRTYGDDETISVPTPTEKRTMYKLWQQTPSYQCTTTGVPLSFEAATQHSRWVAVEVDDNAVFCFTIGPPLSWSDDLFSRATRVDRVVIKDDLNPDVYALKDAWREVCRRPEKDFYDVINRHCEEVDHSTTGMAQCLWSIEVIGHRTRLGTHPTQQRCHMRSLLTPVGIPLRYFLSTRELIVGLETAVKHHKIASEAGVIHRDVSENNVLFDGKTRQAFLVDWDCAEFTPKGSHNFGTWFPERLNNIHTAQYTTIDRSLKNPTGTLPFMAIDILDERTDVAHAPKHDLESFYYLLIWMVLRHTPTTDGLKKSHSQICHELFDNPDAVAVKRAWLTKETTCCKPDLPLFAILEVLRDLFMRQNPPPPIRLRVLSTFHALPPLPPQVLTAQEDVATYENVLRTFTRGLEVPIWPQDDAAKPFVPFDVKHNEKSHAPSDSLSRAAVVNSVGDGPATRSRRGQCGLEEDDSAPVTPPIHSVASLTAEDSEPARKKFKDAQGKGKAPPREASLDNFFEVHLRRPHTEESDTIRALVEESGAELSKAANAVAKASSEVQMYKPLITYLKAVVSTFPTETEPQIYDTHDTLLPCIDPDDHSTAPDITATRPGGNEVKNEEIVIPDEGKWKGEWLDVGTVLELRLRTDILNDDSDDSERTLVKIANSARHLLTSGRYCAFVLAVNGLRARILCFDRAGWQASEAFDWTEKAEIIPTFFWRLYYGNMDWTAYISRRYHATGQSAIGSRGCHVFPLICMMMVAFKKPALLLGLPSQGGYYFGSTDTR
ncbi:hypothetical protein K438DRAFT_2002847 [Mycena galopus ATCC 62051]|nr:hypothetical protein K438DRAFT_2002847 [Mycena galopus ATCC 62051]